MLIAFAPLLSEAKEEGDALSHCLRAWGKTPFTHDSSFKTLSTTVKVFGIGANPKDLEETKEPALIMVNPAVNVMGGTTYELMNPNGWYCFRSNVNVMGGLILNVHCKAHVAFSGGDIVVMSSDKSYGAGTTVMGNTEVNRIGCK